MLFLAPTFIPLPKGRGPVISKRTPILTPSFMSAIMMLTVSNTNTALHTELRYTSLFTKPRALVWCSHVDYEAFEPSSHCLLVILWSQYMIVSGSCIIIRPLLEERIWMRFTRPKCKNTSYIERGVFTSIMKLTGLLVTICASCIDNNTF